MRGYLKFFPVFLSFILITGSPYGSMAAGIPAPPSIMGVTSGQAPPPVSVTPPGTDGLLSGMTPGNYKIPTGWSMIRTQGFEGSLLAPEEVWGSGVISTEKPHSGSKSIKGTYAKDQTSVGWNLDSGVVGTFTEIYLSFYEWIDSTALFNDEFFMAKFAVNSPVYQEILLDWYWAKNAGGSPTFNGPKATLYIVPQGQRDARLAGITATVPVGAWVQWEIHYRPNTSGNSNGFYRIYKDGTLYLSAENANINGSVDMSNMMILVGGTYTKLVWMKDSPTCTACSSGPGEGTDYCTLSKGWSGQSFSNPICAPVDPPLPSFNRFFDDIILMKR